MILLEYPANVIQLRSFWLVLSLIIGLLTGCFLNFLFSPIWIVFGLLITFGLALPGLIRPQFARMPYRIFNKFVRVFTYCANEWILFVCFFIIYITGGTKGSSLRLTKPNKSESLWEPRSLGSSGICGSGMNKSALLPESSQSGWFFIFVRWVIRSGNWRILYLLPFFILIAVFRKENLSTTISENVYTLY